MSSSKELVIKKGQEGQAAEQSWQMAVEESKQEYRQRVFSLGKQIKEWLSGTPVIVSIDTRAFHDTSGFDKPIGQYQIDFITLSNGDKKATFSPEGLSLFGAQGLVSVKVDNPGRSPRTQTFSLFMWHNSMKDAKGWVLAKGGDYNGEAKVLDEDLFFNLISSIA